MFLTEILAIRTSIGLDRSPPVRCTYAPHATAGRPTCKPLSRFIKPFPGHAKLESQYYYTALTLHCWTVMSVRATFFILYLRLFGRIRPARIGSWIGLVFVLVAHGAVGIFCFATANPHEI